MASSSAANRTALQQKNRDKVVQDRLQLLLTRMLQDEDNKYCVDCDSKGPRWASWNIGVFLCIRCAGIHRNLGVHISKVKSVNLDSWTPQQVSSMQVMGNSRARAVYEARIPEEFRRPQSDQHLETFIRSKYEKKKYIALEWTPTKPPDLPRGWAEIIEAEKQKKDIRTVVLPSRPEAGDPGETSKAAVATAAGSTKAPTTSSKVPEDAKSSIAKATGPRPQASVEDLLGLVPGGNPPPAAMASKLSSTNLNSHFDLLCIDGGDSRVSSAPGGERSADGSNESDFDDFISAAATTMSPATATPTSSSTMGNDLNLLAEAFGSASAAPLGSDAGGGSGRSGGAAMSKDSIMALFNQPSSNGGVPNSGPFAMGGAMGVRPTSVQMAGGFVGAPGQQLPAQSMLGFPMSQTNVNMAPSVAPGIFSNNNVNPFMSKAGIILPSTPSVPSSTPSAGSTLDANWSLFN